MFTWNLEHPNGNHQLDGFIETVLDGTPTNWSTTDYVMTIPGGAKVIFEGTFTDNGDYAPTDGTITGFKVYDGKTLLLDASGYSISLLHWNLAVLGAKAGDGSALLNLLLGDSMTIHGSNGNDDLVGGFVSSEIHGRGGDDYILGTPGHDFISGGSGKDQIIGYTGNDVIQGGKGADWLAGFDGKNILTGGAGKDAFVFDGQIGGLTSTRSPTSPSARTRFSSTTKSSRGSAAPAT